MSRRKQSEPCHTGELAAKRKKGDAAKDPSLMNRVDVEWNNEEKARLMQAMERDGGKDDWESIAKAVKTRNVDQVKQYVDWMMAKPGDDSPVITSSRDESLLQNWIQTADELRGEKDNIDGACIPQLSSHEEGACCTKRTAVGSRALCQENTRRKLWSDSCSTSPHSRQNCSCSHLQQPNNRAHKDDRMCSISDPNDCVTASYITNEDNAVSLDTLNGSQRQLLEMVSEQGEALGKLASDMNSVTAFNSQLMKILEHINSRLDNLSAQVKEGVTGAPIIIQAPPRTTIIHQPIETSIKKKIDQPVDTPTAMTPSLREGAGTDHASWPRIKTVASQVPFHAPYTQALTSNAHVAKMSPGISEDMFIPRAPAACRAVVSDKATMCGPSPVKNCETNTNHLGPSLTRTPLSRKYVPVAPTCKIASSMCNKDTGELTQVSVPVNEKPPANTSQTIHYKPTPSSLGQCTPSSTSQLCYHRNNSRNCQSCLASKVTPIAVAMISRTDTCCTTSSTTTSPPPQMSSIDSGSRTVTSVERGAQPKASVEWQEEVLRQCDKEPPILTEGETVSGMASIGGKADVLLPRSLFDKFLQTAAGRPNILALRLAEGLFGFDVLMASTPNGIGDKAALNPHILEAIKDEILSRFSAGTSPLEKRDLWRQCHTAIAQMCKRARSTSKKSNPKRSFDHVVELMHSEAKPDNPFESEYTGSETSLSDREESIFHGLHDIHVEPQEWFSGDGDSDITVVHIPSDLRCSEVRTDIPAAEGASPDQSHLPNSTESHFVGDKTENIEEGIPIGGDEQITINKSKYLEAFKKSNQATVFAVRLAEILFGDDVLEASTITGSRGTERLDLRTMNAIKAEVVKRFLANKEHDIQCLVWKKCLSSIATKCKMLRYTKPLKPEDNAAFQDHVEPS